MGRDLSPVAEFRALAPVASATEWSCGLACLESIAQERGQVLDQRELIQDFGDRYPLWKEKPGACGFHIRVLSREHWLIEWELLDLARHLGLASGTVLLKDPAAVAAHLASGQPVLALTRRSVEAGQVTELNHALRVLGLTEQGLWVMDPGRQGTGRVEVLDGAAFQALEPLLLGFLAA